MITKSAIHFFSEDVSFILKNKKNIREWLYIAADKEGKRAGELNYIFCSDAYLHKMNIEYLDHDTLTDIITFDLSEEEETVSGDIFISVDRAKDNAASLKIIMDLEIARLMIHGLLHLIGYNDKQKAEKALMTGKEDYYLSLLP